AGEKSCYKLFIKFNQTAVPPASVCLDQMHGTVKVCDGHQRLDPIFPAFAEYFFIECEAFFIWLCFIALGKYPGPADTQPKCFKTHFGQHGNVLTKVMIKINSIQSRIVVSCFDLIHTPDPQHDAASVRSMRDYINIGKTASSFTIRALALVGSCSPSP